MTAENGTSAPKGVTSTFQDMVNSVSKPPATVGSDLVMEYNELCRAATTHQVGSVPDVFGGKLAGLQMTSTENAIRVGQVMSVMTEHAWPVDTIRSKVLEAAGIELPSNSRLSVYRTVYEAYLGDLIKDLPSVQYGRSRVDDMVAELVRIPIDKLYHASRLIGRAPKGTDEVIGRPMALWYAKNLPDRTLRELAKDGVLETVSPKAIEKRARADDGLRSLTLTVTARDAVLGLASRLEGLVGGTVSQSKAVEFAMEQVMTLNDESLEYLWREAHGEVTEEEASKVHVLDIEEK